MTAATPDFPPADAPVFAVVGRVNKGKSSIIATLAEDDSVPIDPRPGTTTECRTYPVRVEGRVLFTLVDTPGFEQAPRALDWLRAREESAASRQALVGEFLRTFEGGDDFVEECRLLRPIVDGASVLYVVDGTQPYRPNYEAEMEILRWTGRPGMALVNRIGAADHADAWRRALDQYFKTVRDFDAHAVTFRERVRLLETFRELREPWRPAIDEAIAALERERDRRRAEAADVLATLLADALTLTLEVTVRKGEEPRARREELEQRFHDALRAQEEKARRAVARLYGHRNAHWSTPDLDRPVFEQDLFAEATWRALGLTPKQLLVVYTTAGAVAGGTVDAAVGGASFLAGAAVGALSGVGVWAWQAGRRFARAATPGGLAEGLRAGWGSGRLYRIGPHAHRNFPWVLLDRALLHYDSVLTRTHARRDAPTVSVAAPGQGIVARLSEDERRRLDRLFARVRKARPPLPSALSSDLYEAVAALLPADADG